jgi:hypothetical protein
MSPYRAVGNFFLDSSISPHSTVGIFFVDSL